MQIPEKTRNEIAMALPSLGLDEAKQIATRCACSHDTVYREWRKIKGSTKGSVDGTNPVVLCLIELAVARKHEAREASKRLRKSMRQLSAA